MPVLITSRKNEFIRYASRLTSSAQFRREEGLFVVEGARLCADAAKSGMEISYVFYTSEAEEKYRDYLAPALQKMCIRDSCRTDQRPGYGRR